MGDVEQFRSVLTIQHQLNSALAYLYEELEDIEIDDLDHLRAHDDFVKLSFLKRLLCVRPAHPSLPSNVATTIDNILRHELDRRPSVDISKLVYIGIGQDNHQKHNPGPQIAIWKGDIRDLHGATAIVNAANSQLLGCFQPDHACIDNAIHASAGPQLREACFELMSKQGKLEPEGQAKVTPGFNLLAKYVIHTVGPQLRGGRKSNSHDRALLESCYVECLRAAEDLPANAGGHKSVVFCSISTGLFGYPIEEASQIAVESVLRYFKEHQTSSITHIVFDVFSDKDLLIYQHALQMLGLYRESVPRVLHDPHMPNGRMALARKLWNEADFVIISAGAGLSADAGLDYTSRDVFQHHLPGFLKYGFRRLYDVFGFNDWPSPSARWSYLISHLRMVRDYPRSPVYENLERLLATKQTPKPKIDNEDTTESEQRNYFIRTTNADGFFAKHEFPVDHISTPQGQYAYLQCVAKCRPDATFPSAPYVEQALPFLNPDTQHFPNNFTVSNCPFCGADLVLCVRGGNYFNDRPFRTQERQYRQLVQTLSADKGKKVLLLELGVGMNTPSVLRWHNDDLVRRYRGRFKLVRLGLGPAGYAPLDLEGAGLAVGIEGRVSSLLSIIGSADLREGIRRRNTL